MNFRQTAALGIAVTASTILLPAQDAVLTLDEAISLAMERNFAFQIVRLDPEIARESVIGQESAFDVELFASAQLNQSEQNITFSQVTGTSSDSRGLTAGARKRLVYGTTLTAQTNLDRRDSNAGVNTSSLIQAADFALSLRQPLLSGFGREANTAALQRARSGFAASVEGFRDAVQGILAQTEMAYWAVARWQEQLVLNKSSLEVADTLLRETRERERVGMATQIDVLQAEASRAERMEEIIATTYSLGDAFDGLLAYMGSLPQTESDAIEPSRQVSGLVDSGAPIPAFAQVWSNALATDPGLASQEAVIAQREYDRIAARSAVKPSLDLVLSGAYLGLDNEKMDDAIDSAWNRDGNQWAVGLEFSMPWSMRGEKAQLRTTERRLEQETIRYEERKQELARQVRTAWRALQAVQQSLEAARLTVSLQEAAFEREKSKYDKGLSAFRDVLESQRDLDQARIRLLQAKYNKLQAEIEMARLSGTLFERNGLSPELPTLAQ